MNRKERRASQKRRGSVPADAKPLDSLADSMFQSALQLHQAGRLAEAERLYASLLNLDPGHADALQLLGILRHQIGDSLTGLNLLMKAATLNDRNPEVHYNIALVFAALGRTREAIHHNRRAIELDPDRAAAYENLAVALLLEGETGDALHIAVRGLAVSKSDRLKEIFVRSLSKVHDISDSVRDLALRALEEVWGRPGDLAGPCVSIVKNSETFRAVSRRVSEAWPQRMSGPAALEDAGVPSLANDRLLRRLLTLTPIPDVELERVLTNVRSVLLGRASAPSASDTSDDLIGFWCALAQQCFLNEYIFDLEDSEKAQAAELRERLAAALAAGRPFPALWLAATASYFPLHSIEKSTALLDRAWPESVARLLDQQVRHPQEEQRLQSTIPAITPIENAISIAVRDQYEENPYPRWISTTVRERKISFDHSVRAIFPRAPYQNMNRSEIDILIAGCGTGCHAIEAAQAYLGARVLAIDLSLASLSYAKRKAQSLGIANIEFAQADILGLGSIGRTFDLIEASGSLHHLASPMQGWRVLLSLLRPRGVMRVGLYSALARQDVTAARAFIAERGFAPTPEGIRRCRQDIIGLDGGELLRKVTHALDFYSASGCRDLVFHAQEHQLSIPEIGKFIVENDLVFLGFEGIGEVFPEYRTRYPDDEAMVNLDHWHDFETEHPRLFVGMYQFYVQMRDTAKDARIV